MMWRRKGLIVLSIIASATLLSACQKVEKTAERHKTTVTKNSVKLDVNSPKRAYIKEAVVELVQRPLMEPVTGKITYDESHTVRVNSPIAGRVVTLEAAVGAKIKAGATLAVLDSPELGQAQADYAAAIADLTMSERAYKRIQELYQHGIVPRKDLEQVQDTVTRSKSETQRAQLKLKNLGGSSNQPDNRFALKAPISGTVIMRTINPGMEVRPDLAEPLFTLSDLSHLWVNLDVFEKDIGLIQVGAKVKLSVPAYPGETFPATITNINQFVDETTRTVKVRCSVNNLTGRLLPAMFATVEVLSEPQDKGIVIPLTALFTEDESDWLFVEIAEGHYEKRPVKVGLHLKDQVVILEGLSAGEKLVVDGALLLRTEEDNGPLDEAGKS